MSRNPEGSAFGVGYPDEDPPPKSAPLGQEFLFHLYRGSSLLEDDQVDEAKQELERALSLQPRDIEGQSLLGIVYFRLGHYPRAIRIYEELVAARPDEIAPKVNLALCHLKTGQLSLARSLLEAVVQSKPDHARAWGYLGLTYQRLGDLDKAGVSFERAGRPQLAERMRQSLRSPPAPPEPAQEGGAAIREIEHEHAHSALTVPGEAAGPLEDSPHSVGVPTRRNSLVAPGTSVAVPLAASRFARATTLVFPEDPPVASHEGGSVLVTLNGQFAVRPDFLQAVVPRGGPLQSTPLKRKLMASGLDEPLGIPTAPVVQLEGSGGLVLGGPVGRSLSVLRLDGEPFYLREERLVGFEATVDYTNGRLALDTEPVPLVHLSGDGHVVFARGDRVDTLEVTADAAVEAVATRVLGWIGRLLPRALLPSEATAGRARVVSFSGHGHLLLEWP